MQEEVFLDPTYTLAHPNEATAKLALNENGELGFICSFQTVGDEIIFTGIGLANNKVWLGKTPLVIRASLDGAALQNAARIISSFTPDHTFNAPLGCISNTQSAKIPDSLFNLGSLGTLFKLLGQLQDAPDEEEPPTKNIGKPYFGHPEFNEDEQTTTPSVGMEVMDTRVRGWGGGSGVCQRVEMRRQRVEMGMCRCPGIGARGAG